jgi:ABC-type amino acid transport substrate-binding protein
MLRTLIVLLVTLFPTIAQATKPKPTSDSLKVYVTYNHENFIESSRSYKVGWTLFEQAATKHKIKLNIINAPWATSLELLSQSKIDSAFLAFYSADRAEKISYSVPVAYDSISVYKSSKKMPPSNFKEATVGVHKGSIHAELAKSMNFKATYESASRPELHRMLNVGRIDYILENESLINSVCFNATGTTEKGCLSSVGTPIKHSSLHVIFNKNSKRVNDLMTTINREIINNHLNDETKAVFISSGYSANEYLIWQELMTNHLRTQLDTGE